MKNTILSLVLAFLVLAVSASALGEKVSINRTASTITNGVLYFSTEKGYDLSAQSNLLASEVTTDGYMYLDNKLNHSMTVKFENFLVTLDGDNQANITSPEIMSSTGLVLNALEHKKVNLDLKTTTDLEAGTYSGTFQMVNASDSNPTTRVLDVMPISVLIPALKIKSSGITIKDAESDISDTKLEKGQKFTVTVNYENIADVTDLENVNVKVGIYKGDNKLTTLLQDVDEEDMENDIDAGDLSNGDSDSETFTFEMPYNIDDKEDFTVLAEVTADSADTDAQFYTRGTKTFTSSVADDELAITKLTASPSSLACGVNKAKITAEITNIGSRREDDAQLFLRNTATAFEKQLNNGEDLEIGKDFTDTSDYVKTVEEYVTLTDLKAGQNTYTLVVFYNSEDLNVQKDLVITSQSCTATTPAQNKTTTVITTPSGSTGSVVNTQTTPGTTPIAPISNPSYVTLKDVSGFSFDSDLILPIAIGVGGLIIGIIVALLVIPRP